MAPKAKVEQEIKSTSEDILTKLGIQANVSVEDKGEDGYKVAIETPETGLLIGYHGEVVNSLQIILGVIMYKKTNEWIRIIVDVGDYREKREEVIKRLAEEKAEEAALSGQDIVLPFLTPLERRIVHMTLSQNPKVYSESEGEGVNRRVIIKPKRSEKT
ncbi:KH domain-containing protein [Candidatus Gottesmanbacteria bacterium]|nr:KH domain-containing protein [Candidatus Gottesmanbacteria bacterium]